MKLMKGMLAATMLTAAAGALPGVAQAAVIVSNVSISVPNTIDGVYINVVTGVTGGSGTAVTGWDLNPYNNGAGITFYGAATPSGILATGTPGTLAVARDLTEGTVVGPDSPSFYNQFQTVGSAFQVAGNHILGFRFLNESTGAVNYGYARVTTGAGTGTSAGFPVTITQLVYENTGVALTVGATAAAVPEPATWGMMILGFAMIGAAARKRSVKTTVSFA